MIEYDNYITENSFQKRNTRTYKSKKCNITNTNEKKTNIEYINST